MVHFTIISCASPGNRFVWRQPAAAAGLTEFALNIFIEFVITKQQSGQLRQ